MKLAQRLTICSFLLFISISNHAEQKIVIALTDENALPLISNDMGAPEGIMYELAVLIDQLNPDLAFEYELFPWRRAQYRVENGSSDAFITFPSEHRQQYAAFTDLALFEIDYGYLMFSKDNPNKDVIKNAKSFKDIEHLTFITARGSEWEDEAIPSYFNRMQAPDMETIMHFALNRKVGDFFLMSREEAAFMAARLGYSDQYSFQSVNFIPNMILPFHFGVSKNNANYESIIKSIESTLKDAQFQTEMVKLMNRFRQ